MSVHTKNDVGQPKARPNWYKAMARYEQPNRRTAIWQLASTGILYLLLWYLMLLTVLRGYPYWSTLLLALLAAGLLVRLFIFFHDCTHLSFFASRRANVIWGYILGILTFTPYEAWRHEHVIHHATAGNLDKRNVGDVWTMTVEEYKAATKWQRLAYRLFRHPLIMFGLGPAYMFLIAHRFPGKVARKRERVSVRITNISLVVIVVVAALTVGLRAYVLVQLPVIIFAGTMGLWLFYVQHQFADVYWARNATWDRIHSALEGSSHYQLPKILQWFTGNIGFHHIHHLRARIPNYNLQRCYEDMPQVRAKTTLTLRTSLQCLRFKLWDEQAQRMVGFRGLDTPASQAVR